MDVRKELYIGGEWVPPATSETIDVISPATEEVIGSTPAGSPGDIDRAVGAARRAFEETDWQWRPVEERCEIVARLSGALQAKAQEIADVISSENGSPKQWSLFGQVFSATTIFDAYATKWGPSFNWLETRDGMMGTPVRVRRAPVGVVAAIVPWNVPLFIVALKLAPALVAGCAVVVKPAPETPLDSYPLAEAIADAGVPAGVVNIVPAGRETGDYLIRHPGIDKVSFTGSTAVGQHIGEVCGGQLKRFTLELGGKSAAIVLEDVDLTEANVTELLSGGLSNNGQICAAQSRILAPRSRYDEIVDALGSAVGAMSVGDPLDDSTQVGPLVAERQRTRVEGFFEAGRAEGARVVVGGGRPKHLDRGWFVEPTVFADVDNSMRIAREEIFGPVLSVIPYGDEAEAVRIANDSDYGLSGSVWTSDPAHGEEVAYRMRTGVVAINSQSIVDLYSPFGGFKKSGIGRECGPEGLAPYTEYQSVVLPG
jgi:aldehyde dehydrogenase (NAD+)